MTVRRVLAAIASLLALAGCQDVARLSVEQGMGPAPVLAEPRPSLFPTVHIAPARGWLPGATPRPAAGLAVNAFATGLDHPRWIYVLPNGDVLVAETNAPVAASGRWSVRDWFMRKVMQWAGAAVPSADRITLLRDVDGDGIAETRSVLLDRLHSPFGMALVGTTLYVADTDAVLAFPYEPGAARIHAVGRRLTELPAGPINHHWTKNIIVNAAGTELYATVGSNSNVAENGIGNEFERASIWQINLADGQHRVYASGLRNANGLAWEPVHDALWTVVNERDEIGSDLVPDYLTSVQDGGFYGWPYSYYGQNADLRVAARPELIASALQPDYALGPHTASLGLAYSTGATLAPRFSCGMFVGQHGSWNRRPLSGYKVLFVPFVNGRPQGSAVDVLTGFVSPDGAAMGRPAGVAVYGAVALLVADDVGNTIWRVTALDARPRG